MPDPLTHCLGQGSNSYLCSNASHSSWILNPLGHSGITPQDFNLSPKISITLGPRSGLSVGSRTAGQLRPPGTVNPRTQQTLRCLPLVGSREVPAVKPGKSPKSPGLISHCWPTPLSTISNVTPRFLGLSLHSGRLLCFNWVTPYPTFNTQPRPAGPSTQKPSCSSRDGNQILKPHPGLTPSLALTWPSFSHSKIYVAPALGSGGAVRPGAGGGGDAVCAHVCVCRGGGCSLQLGHQLAL